MSKIIWNKNIIQNNAEKVSQLCKNNSCSLSIVTKFCLSYPELIVPIIKNTRLSSFCDSNPQNLTKVFSMLNTLDPQNTISANLIKTSVSAVEYVYSSVDLTKNNVCFFVSDETVLKKIVSMQQNHNISIVLIAENGDLKDGFYANQICRISENYPTLNIKGVSTNFSCLSGTLPTEKKVVELSLLAQKVAKNRRNTPFLSVGGTVVYDLLEQNQLKNLVQEVRMGEGIFFAYNSSAGCELTKLQKNSCMLDGEIMEICEKEVAESKNTGLNALGEKATSCITGKRRRAILDFGILGARQQDLVLKDKKSFFVGQTFDFSVVDVTESNVDYHTGDSIQFDVNYASASQLMLNPFIDKCII